MGSVPDAAAAPLVRVFIVGGCYAGISAAVNLLDLAKGNSPRLAQEPYLHHPDLPRLNLQITIADERDGYYHLIGSPLAFADTDYAKKAWVKFADIPALQAPNVTVLHGSVSSVDCAAKTATVLDAASKEPTTHAYDYLVAASGLRRVWPVVPQSLTRKQYLLEAEDQIHAVANARDGVVVVGGGAVGIEMAAELKVVKPHVRVTLAHSRDRLLSSEGLSDECKDRSLEMLRECGVEVLMNHRLAESRTVDSIDGSRKYEVKFTNGHKMAANEVVMAISKSVPSTSFLPPSALDAEGYVNIRPNLTFADGTPNAAHHFCGGDAARWSGIKRCGGAMHSGHYMAYNIHQSIMKGQVSHEPQFRELQHVEPMIGLAVGKNAVASGPGMGTVSGPDVMEAYFRDDLGFSICWDYMQLGKGDQEMKA